MNLKYIKYYSKILLSNWFKFKKSYAQHAEDELIEMLFPAGVKSFIDIGANDGVLFSNTYKFAKKKARGLCIEPSKNCFFKLRLNHLWHFKVTCLNLAISDSAKSLFLQEYGYENVLSKITTNKEKNVTCIKADTLDGVLNRHPKLEHPDLVSIDVEGHESEVLDGAIKTLPEAGVIILEIDKLNTDKILKKPALFRHLPAYSNGINIFLLNNKHYFPEVHHLPDGFSRC